MYQNNHYAQRALIKSWSELKEQKRHDGLTCPDSSDQRLVEKNPSGGLNG